MLGGRGGDHHGGEEEGHERSEPPLMLGRGSAEKEL